MSPTAKLTGETFEMVMELNIGTGVDVVEVVVVCTAVALVVDVDADEQAPETIVITNNAPAIKKYLINRDFFLFTLILRFLYPTNSQRSIRRNNKSRVQINRIII